MRTVFVAELPNLTWYEYLGLSHSSHPKRAEFQRSPFFGVLLYLCLHRLTQNDQIRHGSHYGKGRVLGGQPYAMVFAQMRRAVCQRRLSIFCRIL